MCGASWWVGSQEMKSKAEEASEQWYKIYISMSSCCGWSCANVPLIFSEIVLSMNSIAASVDFWHCPSASSFSSAEKMLDATDSATSWNTQNKSLRKINDRNQANDGMQLRVGLLQGMHNNRTVTLVANLVADSSLFINANHQQITKIELNWKMYFKIRKKYYIVHHCCTIW